ncbi:hypothetical protein VTN31DRAFT_6523 [Thermomyces dupontii]|uniref:uncharacterized protein n=1 Tax=Talaromyces thermophilus TaxID=28565 RepID=UPI00374432F6
MLGAKTSAPSTGAQTTTSGTTSLFGSATSGAPSTSSGSFFGNTSKPTTSLFGNTNTTQQQSGSSLFGSTTNTQQQSGTSLFGNTTNTAQQQGGSSLFGGLGAKTTSTTAPATSSMFGTTTTATSGGGTTGSTLFGSTATSQGQSKPAFPSLGGTTSGPSLFSTQNTQQQQQQDQQKPTLSLFSDKTTSSGQQPQASTTTQTVVPGVKVDVSNLLPTTKFESCTEELKKEIEAIDTFILNQIHMCNEVNSLLPTIAEQGATIPNDVEFVQGKVDTIQIALENDARDIDQARKLVSRNTAEAQVAFRAIDNLKLPLQYQMSSGGWWSSEQQVSERQTLRSSIRNRKSTLALPDDVEADPSTNSVNGVPLDLVDYFSQRSEEMSKVLEGYKKNLKEIEAHLHGVEATLTRQINEFIASRNRDSVTGNGNKAQSQVAELAAVLGDVEAGILGVASRLGGVKEEVQELLLGPPTLGLGRLG